MAERETRLVLDDAQVDAVDAVVHEPSRRRRPCVLLTHGAGGDLHDVGVTAMARELATAGHLTVRANLAYRQRSPRGGPPRADRSVAGLAAILTAARSLAPRTPWVIGGKSYGGRVATMLAATDTGGAGIAGVIALGYPLHPPGRPESLRVDHFEDIEVPVVFVQGGNDPFGGSDQLRPHLARLAGPATIVAVPGGDHSLRVPRTRSGDGATHETADVVADLAKTVIAWMLKHCAAP